MSVRGAKRRLTSMTQARCTSEFYKSDIACKPGPDGARVARGVAPLGEETIRRDASVDLMVTSIDQIDTVALANGMLRTVRKVERSI